MVWVFFFFLFPALFHFPYAFFLTAEIENMLCLHCSWCTASTMSRCRKPVRGCAIAAKGVKGSRSSCCYSICLLPNIQTKLYKTMLKIALLACFILHAVKTPYPHGYAVPAQSVSCATISTLLLKPWHRQTRGVIPIEFMRVFNSYWDA